jgi:LysR family nitrogen assimilation transcriptional regulator
LQSIKAKMPHITLVMSEESSGVLATQLLNGSVDLAVLFENPDCINIVSRPLVEEEMHYISRERFTESDDVPVSLETILGNPLMLDGEQQGVHRIVNDFARQYGVKLPRLVAELNSVNMLRAALVGGFANTILPPMSVWQELNNGALFGRAIGEPPLRRKIFICGSSAIPLTTAATSVLELIVELSHQLACSGTWVGATQFSV